MPNDITIELIEPIVGHAGPIRTLKLREPKAATVFRFGELQIATQTRDGAVVYMDREDGVIARYVEACLVEDECTRSFGGEVIFSMLGMADGYQVREALNRFFGDAQRRAYERMQRSSSGNSAAAPSPTS